MPKRIPFNKWIDEQGATRLAKIMGVTRATVFYWKTGHCYPKVHQMKMIRKLSKGRVSYEDIIEGRRSTLKAREEARA